MLRIRFEGFTKTAERKWLNSDFASNNENLFSNRKTFHKASKYPLYDGQKMHNVCFSGKLISQNKRKREI
jgi:hypothetical protein